MPGYRCKCIVVCDVYIEADDEETAMELAEEEALLGCEEPLEVKDCTCEPGED